MPQVLHQYLPTKQNTKDQSYSTDKVQKTTGEMPFAICNCKLCFIDHLRAKIENVKDQIFSAKENISEITAEFQQKLDNNLALQFRKLEVCSTYITILLVGGSAENSPEVMEVRAEIEDTWRTINLLEKGLENEKVSLVKTQSRLESLIWRWERESVCYTCELRETLLG